MAGLTGRADAQALELRMRQMEAQLREMNEAWNRLAPDARWVRGAVPQVSGLSVTRTATNLQLEWDAVTTPDLRYYEVEIDRRGNFPSPEVVRTPDLRTTWTSGYGFAAFYFYLRARAVSNDRRVGPWSPKLESPEPDPSEISPQSGILTLPKRTDAIVVGGTAQTITRIDGGWTGRCVTLYLTVAHTVQDNARLRLEGNFAPTPPASLTLRFFGDLYGWVEVERTGTL